MPFQSASPSSILALVTTLHLGLAALRNHRSASRFPVSSLALASFALTATPWLFPSLAGLAFGIGLHLMWFAAIEAFAPPLPAAATAGASAGPAAAPPAPRLSPRPAQAAAGAGRAPKGFQPTPVLATIDEAPAIKTIRVARPEGFAFRAGQFMPVRVRVDGRELTRCYSISSAPAAEGYLEISVKRQGVVSNALHATARPGAMLSIRPPAGAFTYPAGDDRPIVLIAGGIGVTPLVSMLRHGVAAEPARPIALVYSAHTEADLAFRDELECLARRHPQLRLQLVASTGPTTARIYPGRLDAELLRAAAPDLAHSISFICGPAPMIDAVKTLLLGAGVPPPQIRHEVFEAAVAAAAEAPARKAAPAAPSAGYRVSCTKSRAAIDIARGQTLLEAAEGAGVTIDSLCRAGVCGTCRVQVRSGRVDCETSALGADELDAGLVLACVATAGSDCEVEL